MQRDRTIHLDLFLEDEEAHVWVTHRSKTKAKDRFSIVVDEFDVYVERSEISPILELIDTLKKQKRGDEGPPNRSSDT